VLLEVIQINSGVYTCFILPAIFYLRLNKGRTNWKGILSVILAVFGFIVGSIQVLYMVDPSMFGTGWTFVAGLVYTSLRVI
jgi:uncharacterized membrane protein YqaE (UPF0057 family)